MSNSAHTQKSTSNRTATNLTRFRRDILAAIAGFETGRYDQRTYETYATPHGLAIKQVLEERYDEDINHGRLYPNLDTLVDEGLIAKEEVDRRTNGYTLTEDGRYVLRAEAQWLVGCLKGGDDA